MVDQRDIGSKAQAQPQAATSSKKRGAARAVGLGLVTGAADDDCSAIGTFAGAGAKFGTTMLWTAPLAFPMMFAVVYLSSKLGQVSGCGLFHNIREHYPRWLLWFTLVGVLIGNAVEAAADLGGMAAALNLFIPVPIPIVVVGVAATVFGLQVFASYRFIRNIFRWLSLALFAYVGSAVLANPDARQVLSGTLVPTVQFSREYLSMLVAIIGTTLSAYIYTWQTNVEVEEKIAMGRTTVEERRGATEDELREARIDSLLGMLFASVILYFIMLSTGSTLHKAGVTDIESAAQAAEALRPLAGDAAGAMFALGVVAVGFLSVPVMTAGAAYDLCQVMGWESSLHAKPSEAKTFYAAIAAFTAVAAGMNFLGINPMKALVYSGIVQGFSTPALMALIVLMTNDRRIMGNQTNSRALNILGWITVAATAAASAGLILTFLF